MAPERCPLPPAPGLTAAYLGAERARLWGKALRVFFGHLLHQPLHLLSLDFLFPLLEGGLACDHLVQEAA